MTTNVLINARMFFGLTFQAAFRDQHGAGVMVAACPARGNVRQDM
ncbi:hypothetical protein SXCC_04610 [Gluconacetobacter sp. SXCC-1]|nr:hypothetical protein SXCC_04610 [Gluconacetobacter sp. SXCC-1]